MGALYPGTTVSGYNSNPPPDDGTTVSTNQLTWVRDIKGKIGDPLNTFASSVNTNITNAFNKTLSGGSVVSTATSYGATSADQGRIIVGTASGITVTTPDATSVLAPFVWTVNNQSSGNITVAGFSSQNIDGANTAKIGKGRGIILWTDGSNWFSSGLVMGNLPLANPPFGFDSPINLQLNASVATNILTIAVKANDGTDPTTSNPVLIPFRDNTIANGDVAWVAVTAALSINTNAVGASLGTASSNVPFRIWVLAFNNAGTVVLALWQSVTGGSSPTALAPLNEATIQSTTGISAAATSAGTFYTPNGTTLSNKSFRIIGFIDYASGLTTAGTYASAPTTIQLFGPGIKKPGDLVQTAYFVLASTQGGVGSATYVASNLTASITPTSNPNLVYATASASIQNSTSGATTTARLSRGNSSNTNMIGSESSNTCVDSTNQNNAVSVFALDAPGTSSSQAYNMQIRNNAGSAVLCPTNIAAAIRIDELMA